MKAPATTICLAAWIVAAITQFVFTFGLPDKVVAFGIDISQAAHALHARQAAYIACGLALAIAAFAIRKWRFPLVTVASLFYLLHWFPWRQIGKYGFTATAKSMYVLGSIPGLRFVASIRDVVLPIAFALVIILATLERRDNGSSSRSSPP